MGKFKIDQKRDERGGAAYRAALIAVCATAAALVLVYLAGAFFFAGHYYWRTKIDGRDYSFRSKEKVRSSILNPGVEYELKITGRDGMEAVLGADELGMAYAFDDTLDRFNASMGGLQWPVMFWRQNSCELPKAVVYDEEALEEKLHASVFFQKENIRQPVDAKIGEYESGKGYSIIKEDPGTVLDEEMVLKSVQKALLELQGTLDLTEGGYYSEADVKADDKALTAALDEANRYAGTQITYLWNGAEEVVDADVISQWIEIDQDEVSLDEEAVREYVNSLAKEHDTFGKNRNFTTTQGETITLKSGSYGWWTDRKGEAEELIASIRKGEVQTREPLTYAKGYAQGPPGEDIGSSYVEIDLGSQHLYLYVEGKLITESDLVSGNLARGYGTPAGVFALTYKERDATLTGETYASHVDFWMPFNGNIGMHDASWRSTFGGEIYQNSGSHGCINLPREAAEIIYEHVERGFPVICYY